MRNKFSKMAVVLALVAGILYLGAYNSWLFNDGTDLTLASYFAGILALFSTVTYPEQTMQAAGFSLTEDISIQIAIGTAFLLAAVAILLSLWAIAQQENSLLFSLAMLLSIGVFTLFDFQLALVLLLASAMMGLYIKNRWKMG